MRDTSYRAVAIVGIGSILPDATDTASFWENVKTGRYSISEVSPDRWDPALYFDPDHSAPDKTYSKIGGWVREYAWDPLRWHLAIPPKVADCMDGGQKWAIACTRAALEDYGFPARHLDHDRTAVILGNAMAGEKHYFTTARILFPEYARELAAASSFASLPEDVRSEIEEEFHERMVRLLPPITEDTMPGELSNCIAGRVANTFNFHGPNYVCDAACASAMAAMSSAAEALIDGEFDAVITGGIDRNMGVSSFVKFSKIGALSATGTRPYAEGADGFVMGEGAAVFLMKRLADAERDGDKIYAVLRGIGGSSDGKGKGITAPNPVGQKLAIQRAWENAGLSPATATLLEGHGTSTSVGDLVEVTSMLDVLAQYNLPAHSIALGSVKSNIGHLKGAAGAAGILKVTLALHDKVLPPSVNCAHPNPNIDFAHSPLYVNTELRPWPTPQDGVRRAGVSAFGFGGTNFHAVLEEYIPHRLSANGKKSAAINIPVPGQPVAAAQQAKAPLRGALVLGAPTVTALAERLRSVYQLALTGDAPAPTAPAEADLRAAERIAIDYTDAADLADKAGKALKAFAADQPAIWKALRPQAIYRGQGPAAKVAFLYPGQGSQYVNMLRPLCKAEPIVAEVFAEADRVMTPILGKPLSEFVFVDKADSHAVEQAEEDLRQTAITQPAVLAADQAVTKLLAAYGIRPDMTMGHSLGEYGALVASGALPFAHALEAVSARGREMTRVSWSDNGKMAAVFAPIEEIERILKTVDGYVVIANLNSDRQAVIGGASKAVEQASEIFLNAGYNAVPLSVSHAFHTSIVAPASAPLRSVLERLHLESPHVPIAANVNGEFYPTGPGVVPQMLDILSQQVAAPVQFVKGLKTIYDAGARIFVEVGPKKALQGFVEDVLGDRGDVVSMFTNHPKLGDIAAFNQALCALYAAGLGAAGAPAAVRPEATEVATTVPAAAATAPAPLPTKPLSAEPLVALGQIFADAMDRASQLYHDRKPDPILHPVAISGAALGLPGTEHIFDDGNVARILRGEQLIDVIPTRFRKAMLDKHITRLVKSDNGGPVFETITNAADVIKLAGRGNAFNLETEFGVSADRVASLDRNTALAMAVGLDALRDAGIPLVLRYKTTSKGTRLPDRWVLPEDMRDDTGVIFASVFPGFNRLSDEITRYHSDRARREELAMLEGLRARAVENNGNSTLGQEIERQIAELRVAIDKDAYTFDRRFLFRVLSMGHSQFAEFIGARGPNTQINAACASTTQATAVAEDWIRAGRCRRVVVISADDITTDQLIDWFGAGFLASGAAATDEVVEDAAMPFDRRRHGMVIGMGAAGFVVESHEAMRERGIRPICELLGAATANSAFHGTRLDVEHIAQVMESLVSQAEKRGGVSRRQMAESMVFVSHETYTPARGGSASAEIHALRRVFGDVADHIVIANTKGFTGHAMGAGIEDVVAMKALETGCVPPVANFKEVDPELGVLNLSKGGIYPVEYALRLGAGFGSQISMTLFRMVKSKDGSRPSPNALGYANRIADKSTWEAWLTRMAGRPSASLEVVQRTLRVAEQPVVQAIAQPVAQPVAQATGLRPNVEPKPEPKPKPEPAPAPAGDPVQDEVLSLVSKITGYPIDMLALDLDLEADLGIDTVKQAEVFASIRQTYGIERDDKIKLREFPTLAHVIQFVHGKRPDLTKRTPPAPPATVSAPVAAPVPAPEMTKRTPPAPPVAADPLKDRILALVVEKTGYPPEMLDLDLDLEADLGIDTVKQAELFAAIRQAYDIPRDPNLKLRDFPTLAHVVQFARERAPVPASEASKPPAPVPQPQASESDAVREKVLAIVAEKTGYPKDMLDLDLDLEADLGIDTVKQAEMFASIRAAWNIPRDPNLKLRDFPTLAHVIQFAKDRAPVPASEARPTPAPQAQTPVSESDEVREKVLAIVAEKTGYPKDMLDLDLDLEADLGIDTVKQAEMFASIRAAWNIPRNPNLKLRDFPTLAHVIQFARNGAPAPASEASKPPALGPPPPAQASEVSPVANPQPPTSNPASVANQSPVPRRVPVPVVRPPLNLCKQTTVTLSPGTRVLVVPDKGGVAAILAEHLRALGLVVVDKPEGTIAGVYWLPALDDEGNLLDMDLPAWHDAVQVRVKSLYTTMRALYAQSPFLVSATRLGGLHGYDAGGATSPMGGAVTGFTKAYKQEKRDTLVKAVDFEPGRKASEIADMLIAETMRDPGAVEIGYQGAERFSITLAEQPAEDGQTGMTLGRDTVFVVTGAAGSIVSAITADLAAASGGTFYLLDMVPEPAADNPDFARFANDKDGLKRDLFARIQTRGERATPAMVEKELAALERAYAARTAIEAVKAAGGTAHYLSVNLTDGEAVARAIAKVREQSGRIDVLLHAAGLERSHFLPDKDPREFDLVFDVKSDGWFHLLRAIGDMPLGATVAFSSVAGRFGNGGQTDYSAANDLLCKITSSFRTTRPNTRGIVIDWTAWGGIGMATRGSIPKMMELAGIDMLPPEAGIPLIRLELTVGGTRGEVLVGKRLGILQSEWDADGGLDLQAMAAAQGPMCGKVAGMSLHGGLTVETTLDPRVQPFLYDHQIDGTPVLPGVMGVEAFAEAARAVLPGWHVAAVEQVNFLAPFKFYRNEPRTVTVHAMISPQGDGMVADCQLSGSRALPNQAEPQITTHFTSRVRLAKGAPMVSAARPLKIPTGATFEAADIYHVYFHGPAYQVLERAWVEPTRVVGQMSQRLPENHRPAELPVLMAPRLIELCEQTAGLWEIVQQGRMGLPLQIDHVAVCQDPAGAQGPLFAVVTCDLDTSSFDAEVVDTAGNRFVEVSGYRTVALGPVNPELLRVVEPAMA
ncbi:MAG TPA: SDR family NAD(P)-dependent oxidoreductase [Bryobacteraceae bacterium]|nr:SDR family NAD(P)-dependent oxidoreductase [Bryobacteraceae bacterium]